MFVSAFTGYGDCKFKIKWLAHVLQYMLSRAVWSILVQGWGLMYFHELQLYVKLINNLKNNNNNWSMKASKLSLRINKCIMYSLPTSCAGLHILSWGKLIENKRRKLEMLYRLFYSLTIYISTSLVEKFVLRELLCVWQYMLANNLITVSSHQL